MLVCRFGSCDFAYRYAQDDLLVFLPRMLEVAGASLLAKAADIKNPCV